MRLVAAALAMLVTAGCVHLPANALPVPAVRQQTGYSCGPAALAAMLRYWDQPVADERALYAPLHTTQKDGTEPDMLAAVARAHGLGAAYRTGVTVDELRAALAAGTTVILDLQAWRDGRTPWRDDWEDGHYVVLVAIDGDRLYAMDPSSDRGYAWLPLAEFAERWHDYELRDGLRRNFVHGAIFVGAGPHGTAPRARVERLH